MNYLVMCPCGHALDRHGEYGCGGDGLNRCSCALGAERALDAAISEAALHPWGVPHSGGDSAAHTSG
jgi:hypothetical protein